MNLTGQAHPLRRDTMGVRYKDLHELFPDKITTALMMI
ncbi:hypothetical protein OPIT5_26985 [Opitutaceae bacterium TAV5]|nr:hypothetical protein OPIT5_26985 [Opitutaceae bacterium TAV5]